jgi:hypothetical protein
VVDGLAADARLQIELLLLEAEELESVRSALSSFERLSRSSERLAGVAEKLPQDLRREWTAALDAADFNQAGVQSTLKETQATATTIQQASERLAAAGRAWSETARTITEMADHFRKRASESRPSIADSGSAEGPQPAVDSHSAGRLFDINDYAKAADSYNAAAKELANLAIEIRRISESNQLPQRVAELRDAADGVVDHVAWRAAQIVLLIFVVAVAYRFATVRIAARK